MHLPWKKERIPEPGLLPTYLIVLVIFSFLALVLTYPLCFEAFSRFPGSTDIYVYIWQFWYTNNFIIHASDINSIFYTTYLFYPNGTPVIALFTVYNQLLSLLLIPLIGSVLTCNIIVISTFILSGFGAYLLCRHITKDDTASVIAGIVYTFAPYHFDHAYTGHLGAITMQWIPFCALFIIKMFEERKLRDSVIAALFFILVAMSDQQYAVFMGVFVGLFIIYQFLVVRSMKFDRKDVMLLLVFGILSLIVVVLLNYGNIMAVMSGDNYLKPVAGEAAAYSVDLLNFVIPSVNHPLVGSMVNDYYYANANGDKNTWEGVAFIGFSVLLLVIYASVRARSADCLFWCISTAFFALMSLGPILHIHGQTLFFGSEIPMPFSVLSHVIPGLNNSRTPGRFEVMTLLSISVMGGMGISRLKRDMGSLHMDENIIKKFQVLVPLVIITLILFEYLAVPFVTSDPSVPEFYYSVAKEPGDFAIIEIPATANYSSGIMAEYYQTIHNKKMVGGQLARVPDSSRVFEHSVPFINEITYLKSPSDIITQNKTAIASSILNNYNIRYVILHKDFVEEDVFEKINNLINEALGPIVYSDEQIVVYKVNTNCNTQFIEIGQNWNEIETWDGTPTRWIEDNATIKIHSPEDKTAILSFSVLSFNNSRQLLVVTNDNPAYSKVISPGFMQVKITVNLKKGDNVIRYIAVNGPVLVSDVLHNGDNRLISFAFQNISIE